MLCGKFNKNHKKIKEIFCVMRIVDVRIGKSFFYEPLNYIEMVFSTCAMKIIFSCAIDWQSLNPTENFFVLCQIVLTIKKKRKKTTPKRMKIREN